MGALLLIVPKDNTVGHVGKGDFDILNDGTIMRAPGGIYTGAQIINPESLSNITDDVFSMNVVWDKLAKQNKLFGVAYTGKWCDVGQPESIPLAEAMLGSDQRV